MFGNMYAWVEEQIKATRKKAMPVLSFPAIQLMDITVKELIGDSDLQAEGMKRVAERVPAAASVSLMDLSVEAEAFGSQIRFSDEEVPAVIGSIVSDEGEAEALAVPAVGTARTGLYVEALGKAVKKITDRPVFAGVIGPFSLAGRLLDVSEAMVYCYDEPDMVHTVLEKCTAFLIAYIREYRRVGADGVVIAEPLGGLLSPALALEFSTDYVKKIVDAVQDEHFLVIYHNCGNATVQQAPDLATLGCKAYHFGNAIRMADIIGLLPKDALVMGNVDPAGEFRNGTADSIRAATRRVLEECASHPNFVISSGCDIPPMSKWENIEAFFDEVEKYYHTIS